MNRGAARVVFRDYSHSITPKEAYDLVVERSRHVKQCRVDPETGCWLALTSTDIDGRGFVQRVRPMLTVLSGGTVQKKDFYLHRLAFMAFHGRDRTETSEISHLCGRRACFSPAHVAEESHAQNVVRSGFSCPGVVTCGTCDRVLAVLCTHEPPCMRSIVVDCCRLGLVPVVKMEAVAVPCGNVHSVYYWVYAAGLAVFFLGLVVGRAQMEDVVLWNSALHCVMMYEV